MPPDNLHILPPPSTPEYNPDDLNQKQSKAYTAILQAVLHTADVDDTLAFFIDGPGGTGKTRLYNTLISTLHTMNLKVITT